MMRVFTRTALLAVAVITAATSAAQLRDFENTGTGHGTWDFGRFSKNPNLDEVQVTLRPDHHAIIRLARTGNAVIEGRWSNDSDQRVNLQIEKIGRSDATGQGTLDHDRNGNLLQLRLSGMSDRENFTLDFTTQRDDLKDRRGPGGAYRGDNQSFSSTQDGRGTLSFSDLAGDSRVRRISVNLRDNGTAEIRLLSGSSERIYGHWKNAGNRSTRISIDRIGRDDASGWGTVDWDSRGDFSVLNLKGNARGHRFELAFTTVVPGTNDYSRRNRSGDDADRDRLSGEDRTFLDNARRAVEEKFGTNGQFEWSRESVGGNSFGTRSVTGEFRITSGRDQGTYTFKVVLGAGTSDAKSVSYHRI